MCFALLLCVLPVSPSSQGVSSGIFTVFATDLTRMGVRAAALHLILLLSIRIDILKRF